MVNTILSFNLVCSATDMEKGTDAQKLFAEIFETFGNIRILEDYLLLFWNKTIKKAKFLLKY